MGQKYDEIKAFLKAEALRPESRLRMPTIQELMQRFGASQSPVSRAVHDLEREGILYCRRGAGIVSRAGTESFAMPEPGPAAVNGTLLVLCVDYFASSLWSMTHTLNGYARQLGYAVQHYRIQRDSDRRKLIDSALELPDVRGLVLIAAADRPEQRLLDYLGELPFPVVLLDSFFTYEALPENISVLRPDAFGCGEMAAGHLFEAGHRKVGFIRSVPDGSIPQLAIAGAAERMKALGGELRIFSTAVKSWENEREASRRVAFDALEAIRKENISALICIGCSSTMAARRVLWEEGIRIPEEVSLISIGDGADLPDCCPALSAAAMDFTTMSCDALDIVNGRQPRCAEKLYSYRMVPRESVAYKKPEMV